MKITSIIITIMLFFLTVSLKSQDQHVVNTGIKIYEQQKVYTKTTASKNMTSGEASLIIQFGEFKGYDKKSSDGIGDVFYEIRCSEKDAPKWEFSKNWIVFKFAGSNTTAKVALPHVLGH